MGRKIRLLVLFTCVHGIVTLGAAVYAMTAASARFDNPELPRVFGETAAEWTAKVLMLPGRVVWTSWASKNLPNIVEWLLFLGNSALWGALGVIVTTVSAGRYRRLAAPGLNAKPPA